MKTIIIDDELPALEALQLLLERYCPDITVVATASSFREAYDTCRELQPELVFCDIQFPAEEGTGLDLVQLLNDQHMKVIFTSGWKDFAADAFRVNAVDYLLKPLNITQLMAAVEKARQKPATVTNTAGNGHLQIPTQHGFLLMPFPAIIRCQAAGPYTHFHCSGKQGKLTSSVTLGHIEAKLPETHFFRVHKTHLVNRNHVLEYIRTEGGAAVRMSDNTEVPVSRLLREAFIKWLG